MQKCAMRPISLVMIPALVLTGAYAAYAQLCIQYNGQPYSQNFNTMPVSGSSNIASTLPIGFAFSEVGSGNNVTYAASDGSSNAANTYSFGTTGNTERAFGELGSPSGAGALSSILGMCVVNNIGAPLTAVTVGYTGEMWRKGGTSSTPDRLDFQYSVVAAALNTQDSDWTDVDELDFASPNPTASVGPLNGNAAGNRTVKGPFTIKFPTPVGIGQTFFMRWKPLSLAGANDGLAIDDFFFDATINCNLDVDGDGQFTALRDGLVLIRAMFGFSGDTVTVDATKKPTGGKIDPASKAFEWEQIAAALNKGCGTNFPHSPPSYP